MTRDERRRRHANSARILAAALAIVRREEASRVFDPDTCATCDASAGLILCHVRHGWGRTRSKWEPARPLCADCRKRKGGHWKYAKGAKPGKLPKPDPDLEPVQVEPNEDGF